MMKTTNFGHGADGAARRRAARVFVERQMRSRSVVVLHVCPQPPVKVPLVEDEHVIEQLAEDDAVGRVAIWDQIARGLFPWECLGNLLRIPRSSASR
jgi:hypothetical protein